MSQMSFSDAEYAGRRKKTRREVFLEEMEQVSVPGHPAAVRFDEASLPRTGQEHRTRDHAVRAVEPVDGAQAVDGDGSSPSATRMTRFECGHGAATCRQMEGRLELPSFVGAKPSTIPT